MPRTPELEAALGRFDRLATDYSCFLWTEQCPPTLDDLHTVLRGTVDEAVKRACAQIPARHREKARASFGRIDEDRLSAAKPREIDWPTFLGPGWNGPDKSFEEVSPSQIDPESAGYVHAFAMTPYGTGLRLLSPPQSAINKFVFGPRPEVPLAGVGSPEYFAAFKDVLRLVVRAEIGSDSVTIWRWPTDWSSYFDAGHEWWGSYCWTLWTRPDHILGIVASTTD